MSIFLKEEKLIVSFIRLGTKGDFSELTVETLWGYGFLFPPGLAERRFAVTHMYSTAQGVRGPETVLVVFLLFLHQYLDFG